MSTNLSSESDHQMSSDPMTDAPPSTPHTKLARLQATLSDLQKQRNALARTMARNDREMTDSEVEEKALAAAKKITQDHIRLLTEYNEIKDVAINLIGMIAENRQQRIVDVMKDFDLAETD